MSLAAWAAIIISWAIFLGCAWAFCRAAADPRSDLLAPHPDEQGDPADVFDFETGEPIRDLDAWCVSVSPDRRPVA